MRLKSFAFLLIALLLSLAGCGSGGDSSTLESAGGGEETSSSNASAGVGNSEGDVDPVGSDGEQTQSTSSAEFVERANALCVASRQQMRAEAAPLIEKSTNARTQDDLVEEFFNGIVAPGLEEEIEGIRALGIPPEDSEQVEAILAATEETLDRIREDPAAVALQDRLFAKSENLARDYGAPACGAP